MNFYYGVQNLCIYVSIYIGLHLPLHTYTDSNPILCLGFSGTYQGQWLRGLRHGYGVRTSAPFGMASHFRPKAPAGSMASLKSESAAEPTSERYMIHWSIYGVNYG